jgi:putative flippase GtrA
MAFDRVESDSPATPGTEAGSSKFRRLTYRVSTVAGVPNYEKLIGFVLVGILNTAFGYGVFAALYAVTGWHRVAIVLATVIGVVFNFFTTGRLVFRNAAMGRLVPFALGYGVVLVVNIVLVDAANSVGISPFLGQALALPVTVCLAFVINDRLVFERAG